MQIQFALNVAVVCLTPPANGIISRTAKIYDDTARNDAHLAYVAFPYVDPLSLVPVVFPAFHSKRLYPRYIIGTRGNLKVHQKLEKESRQGKSTGETRKVESAVSASGTARWLI